VSTTFFTAGFEEDVCEVFLEGLDFDFTSLILAGFKISVYGDSYMIIPPPRQVNRKEMVPKRNNSS
jgi:hypothetical protein